MGIADWLRELGLERYAELFRANDIGLDILADLGDTDLTALGVSLGDRKRLLRAISMLREQVVEPAAPLRPQAERRQLTVMFVDLVGSTGLSTLLDPEELSEVIHRYQTTVAAEVARFEGHVAKYMGDGVLAYFGWPLAHEDEPERAVRAGLATAAAVAGLTLPSGWPMAGRVGIATGMVVVGDLIGQGAAQEEAVIGETPNLAARLQAVAEPGTVVMADSTRLLVGRLFELSETGPLALPGFGGPVTAFRVDGARTTEGRFEALRGQRLTPLVGREHEIGLLLDRWRRACTGAGQVVLLVGEAGIGKSRLLQELQARVSGEPHTRMRFFCSPFHQNTALHPILDQIERAARFDPADTPAVKLNKLDALFATNGAHAAEAAALTAAHLGIPTSGGQMTPPLAPQQRKTRLQELWLQQLVGLAARRPVLMLLEDAHWMDPSSIEQFNLVIKRIDGLQVLLIVTFRPDFCSPWDQCAYIAELHLDRVSAPQSIELVKRIAGSETLLGPVLDQIIARAEGVPLFLEELTRTVLELPLTGDAVGQGRPAPLPIPATLQDSLMSRLDRLAPVKQVAQIAAALGREFSRAVLATVSRLDEAALDDALHQLVAADLIFRRHQAPETSFAFKHALVQEAAYATLLRGPRQAIHARIAAALRDQPSEQPPEIMAHHLTEAGETEAASGFWAQAGERALSRAASIEAAAHFKRALEQILLLPDTTDRKRREAALQSALGSALINITGLASEALATAYARVRDLCLETGDIERQFVAEWNIWHIQASRAQHRQAQALAGHLMEMAKQRGDPELELQALHVHWSTLCFAGEHRAALASCERGWALYDPAQHGAHAFTYGGHDPGVCSRMQAALETWCLGRPDTARAVYQQGLALARSLGHPQIVLHALAKGLPLLQLLRDRRHLEDHSKTTLKLAEELNSANFRTEAQFMRGWVLSGQGEHGQAVQLMQNSLRERQASGETWANPYFLSLLARVQARAGALDEALATLGLAAELAQSTGDAWGDPDLLRIKGELVLARGSEVEEVEQCLTASLALARTRLAPGWELRSATSLARLWARQARSDEARSILAPAYQIFEEGFSRPDLVEARSLLADLG